MYNEKIIEKLKQKILDLAIRGKLVPQDPNDEPASVLIEKIRKEKEKLIKEGKIKKPKEDSFIFKGSDNCYYENVNGKIKNIHDEIQAFYKDFDQCNFARIECTADKITDFVASGSFASLRENVNYYKTPNYALMVKTQDFQNGFTKDLTYTDKKSYEYLSNSNLNGGELILSNIGSIGKVFIVPKLDIKMTLASNSIMIVAINETITKWMYYFFKSSIGQKYLNEISSGSTMKKFNKTELRKVIIPLYSFKYIVNSINKVELLLNLITDIQQGTININSLKANLKNKILESIFSPNSSYKSYYENRISTNLEEYIDKSDIGDGDWVLSENMDDKGNIKLIQLKHIGSGNYIDKPYCKINNSFFEQNKCSEIKEDYLLINRLVSDKMNVCIMPNIQSKCITSVDVCWIKPNKRYLTKYLMYYLMTPCFQKEVLNLCSGSTRKRISKKNLIKIPMLIHSFKDQKEIVKKIDNIFTLIDNM